MYFQLPYLPEETCFLQARTFAVEATSQAILGSETCSLQAGTAAVEATSQAILGSSDQRKVPASQSLFLKSEKIPALLYGGKGI